MVEAKNNIRLAVTAGDTVAWNVIFNNITENLRLAYFTVKENPDDEAVIQKTLNAGITLVDDRAYRDQKTYKIQLQSEDTAGLSPDLQYMYDLKVAIGNVVKTIISGVFVVRVSATDPTQIIVNDAEVQAVDLISAEFETTEATAGIEYEQDPVASAKIGTMTNLNTTQKSTLVGAINEVNTKASNTKDDVDKILDGTLVVPSATNATHATSADSATNAQNAQKAIETNISSDDVDIVFSGNGPDLQIAWTYPNGNWLLVSAKISNEIYNFGILFYPYVELGSYGVDISYSPIIRKELSNDVIYFQARIEPCDGHAGSYFAMANVYSKINDGAWNKTSATITVKQIR